MHALKLLNGRPVKCTPFMANVIDRMLILIDALFYDSLFSAYVTDLRPKFTAWIAINYKYSKADDK